MISKVCNIGLVSVGSLKGLCFNIKTQGLIYVSWKFNTDVRCIPTKKGSSVWFPLFHFSFFLIKKNSPHFYSGSHSLVFDKHIQIVLFLSGVFFKGRLYVSKIRKKNKNKIKEKKHLWMFVCSKSYAVENVWVYTIC